MTPALSQRCVYCAFKSRQWSIQARRFKSSAKSPGRGFISYVPIGSSDSPGREEYPRGRRSSPKERRDSRRDDTDWSNHSSGSKPIAKGSFIRRTVGQGKRHIESFEEALEKSMAAVKEELSQTPVVEQIRKESEAAGKEGDAFARIWKTFNRSMTTLPFHLLNKDRSNIRDELNRAFKERGERELVQMIKYKFYGHISGTRFTDSDIKNQQTLADLRYPTEWFPATRAIQRTVHLHVGPTNSGKTYHALQRLEQAERGIYAGPLRLLAHEVYTRMNAKGKQCALLTGEERRSSSAIHGETGVEDKMSACTVEMVPLNHEMDVAIIDEIQMIGNAERGWAWTQAFLGVKAKEVHLCGEVRTVPIIQELCAALGEELVIHRYERLSPLKMADQSLKGNLSNLQKGDCIVSFSVMGIHALRSQIEKKTGKKVATVYGSLPPETRAQQARLFNDPDNDYDYLVASDAVGMGLNLAIKRVVFEASNKFDGFQRRTLSIADIKQIGGRAGRYRTAAQASETPTKDQDLAAAKGDALPEGPPAPKAQSIGIVTTLEDFDFPVVEAAMSSEPEPIPSAGLFPPSAILERFASYFPPRTPFSYILLRLHELSQVNNARFHLCGLKDQLFMADLIEPIRNLTVSDRNVICSAPAAKGDAHLWKKLMPAYARCIAEQTPCSVAEVAELPLEILEAPVSASREYLRELEILHKGLVAYLWLSYRFAGIFSTRALAVHAKSMVEEKIETVLGKFSFTEKQRLARSKMRQAQLLADMENLGSGDQALAAEGEATEGEAAAPADDTAGKGEVVEDGESVNAAPQALDEHTSVTAGGDHFAGQEDMAIDEGLWGDRDASAERSPSSQETASSSEETSLPTEGLHEEENTRSSSKSNARSTEEAKEEEEEDTPEKRL